MSYQVTARKWRPMVFDDVIGQSHVSNTLRNALAQNRLAHAFIFSGTRGCGKTTTARILARAVNCLNPKNFEPCNECEVCKEITDGRSLDVIEIDGASNRGVDEIRNLRESVRYAPTRGKRKVYIIDEVHMLTKEAFNALLKTLEEPPPHVLFIFATTELHKVPATILSRCQRYDFRRISVEEIIGRLKFIAQKEAITIDDDSLLIIAKKGDGSMRDAQSIFDQVISFCGTTIESKQVADALNIVDQELFFKVSDAIKAKDTKAALELVEEVIHSGYDTKEFVSGVAEHFRNMLIAKTTGSTLLIEESEIHRKRYGVDVESFSLHDLLRMIKTVTDTENTIRYSVQPRFKLEVMMIQLTKMDASIKIDDLLSQIDDLKKKVPANNSPVINSKYSEIVFQQPYKVPPSVEEAKPRYTFAQPVSAKTRSAEMSREENGNFSSISTADISFSAVQQGWEKAVDEMRKKKISVGTILGETTPLEIINGTLRIGCDDEFHRSTLVRNKEILTETINTVLSSKLRIEPILQSDKAANIDHKVEGNGNSHHAPQQDSIIDNHPLVKTLYKDFGAERIS
jgi:DNA polymerase III subunit gamma/tau